MRSWAYNARWRCILGFSQGSRYGGGDRVIETYFEYVVNTLELFRGQLTLQDIYNSTYKELGYLRKFREPIAEKLAKSGDLSALLGH